MDLPVTQYAILVQDDTCFCWYHRSQPLRAAAFSCRFTSTAETTEATKKRCKNRAMAMNCGGEEATVWGGKATIGSCENFESEESILLVKVVEAAKR